MDEGPLTLETLNRTEEGGEAFLGLLKALLADGGGTFCDFVFCFLLTTLKNVYIFFFSTGLNFMYFYTHFSIQPYKYNTAAGKGEGGGDGAASASAAGASAGADMDYAARLAALTLDQEK